MGNSSPNIELIDCSECGYRHPRVEGKCPAALLKDKLGSDKEKKIHELNIIIRKFLEKDENYDVKIKRIISFINKYDMMFKD